MKSKLELSEVYPAVQAEGSYSGYSAVLVRLFGTDYHDRNSIHIFASDNPEKNKKVMEVSEVVAQITKLSLGNKFHLIITGGEPLLQQEGLISFFKEFEGKFGRLPFVEMETNGRTVPLLELDKYVGQYNVQVKLGNSAHGSVMETHHNRIKKDSLNALVENKKAKFLFEIRHESDMKEVKILQSDFKIVPSRIWLKPFPTDTVGMMRTLPYIEQQCLAKGYRMSNRFNILLHGPKKRGV